MIGQHYMIKTGASDGYPSHTEVQVINVTEKFVVVRGWGGDFAMTKDDFIKAIEP